MVEVQDLNLGGALLLRTRRHQDHRGWFCETFSQRWFDQAGIPGQFLQDNLAWSEQAGTLRGLHAQRSPAAQAKLVSVISGTIFDVVVDCRNGSSTYGQWRSIELSAREPSLLFIPAGFCHGFLTLEHSATVFYKVSDFYSPEHETGLRWDDPDLNIDWPLNGRAPIIADKDRKLELLAHFSPL